MVIAQAIIEVDGDSLIFTFTPVHRSLRNQLEAKRAWIEQLAQSASGRRITVQVREIAAPAPPPAADDADADRKSDLKARAKAEPIVQAVLDVFGGDVDKVEEIE